MAYNVNQESVEKVVSRSLCVDREITRYGGLCGGWSMMLLRGPHSAMDMWDKFERLELDGKFVPGNITTEIKMFFRSVMYLQYRLDYADAESDANYGGQERENSINLLADLVKKPHFQKPTAVKTFYDIEGYEIIDADKWVDIKEMVDQHPMLLATDTHFMAIRKAEGARNRYYLSETENVGYMLDTWEKIRQPLKVIVGRNCKVHLKYSNWTGFSVRS